LQYVSQKRSIAKTAIQQEVHNVVGYVSIQRVFLYIETRSRTTLSIPSAFAEFYCSDVARFLAFIAELIAFRAGALVAMVYCPAASEEWNMTIPRIAVIGEHP
jgi:hypothetical protein